jgi:hypothetical protein
LWQLRRIGAPLDSAFNGMAEADALPKPIL